MILPPTRPKSKTRNVRRSAPALLLCVLLAACADPQALPEDPFAPGIDPRGTAVDQLTVGDRLLVAGEGELALEAYARATLEHGLTPEIYAGLGTANLQLGRLGQAETQLRKATDSPDALPETWNNLGIALIGLGEVPEAVEVLRRAYALDNGESDAIRENLRLALDLRDKRPYDQVNEEEFRVVRSGRSLYKIRAATSE